MKKITLLRAKIFFKQLIPKKNNDVKRNLLQAQELEWAHIYHDSIRGLKWMEELPINIGRWAGNYSFFYVLNRILYTFKPTTILELGLGESSKFISTYIDNLLYDTKHIVIEHEIIWKDLFLSNFKISKNTDIIIRPLMTKIVKGKKTNSYKDLEEVINSKFEMYIIDGPFGSKYFSRYDIMDIAKHFTPEDQFIIIIDDYQRKGEKETTKDLLALLKLKKIKMYTACYSGNKSVFVISTEKYRYATSL